MMLKHLFDAQSEFWLQAPPVGVEPTPQGSKQAVTLLYGMLSEGVAGAPFEGALATITMSQTSG